MVVRERENNLMDFMYLKFSLIAWLLYLILNPILSLALNIWASKNPIKAICQQYPVWTYLISAARVLACCFGIFYLLVFVWGY